MSQMFAVQDLQETDEMQVGTQLLNGQYLIESQLQRGGFGITYVAQDSLERRVVIKECFPAEICTRYGGDVYAAESDLDVQFSAIKRQFVREARRLAKLKHPHIVAVHQVFEENNTAYMALDQVIGEDLLTVQQDQPERLTNDFLAAALSQSLEAIRYTHEHGVLHRDISPDNILVDDSGHLTLIDFGAAREHSVHANRALSALIAVKDGYSPHEFYLPDVMHDFSSDLYSLGATFYHLVTGTPPPNSQLRLSAISAKAADPYVPLASGEWNIDYNILATIDRALEILQENRFQCAGNWIADLESTPKTRPVQPKAPVFDENFETQIAQIVRATNNQTVPGKPKKERASTAPEIAPKSEDQRVVDIFGNPVDDVAAWLKEQESEIRARQAKAGSREMTRYLNRDMPDFLKQSVIANLVLRCLPGSKVSLLP